MSRRNEEEAVSLFSFQDIITSITGIMFLIVLLLILIMISSHLPSGISNTTDSSALQSQLEALKKRAAALQNSQDFLSRELDKLRSLSPEEAAQKRRKLLESIHEIQQKNLSMAHENQIIEQENISLQNQLNELLQTNTRQQADIERLNAEQLRLQHTLRQQQQKLHDREKLIKYTIERPGSRSPILLELGKNGIQLLKLDDHSRYDLRHPSDPALSFAKFKDFIGTHDPALYYFTVAVQPGGFQYAAQLLTLLKQHHFQRGIEILPDDDTTLAGGHDL